MTSEFKKPVESEKAADGGASDGVRRLLGRAVGAGIVIGTLVLAIWVYLDSVDRPRTDDAYVRANTIGVAPHVSGLIVEMPIVDNQPVQAGELLFVVDPRPYVATLDQAKADLLLTELEIEGLGRAVLAAEAELAESEAKAAYATQYVERVEPLLAKKFVTANQVFEAETQAVAALAAVERSRFRLEQTRKDLGQLGNINARRQVAQARVVEAQLNVDYCYVRAPFDGFITNLNTAIGEYANIGQEVFALVDNRNWYVMANFRETFLDAIKPGMTADVYLMSYPGRLFKGRVQGIGWALWQRNGSTVSGLPDVEPNLNWVRLAQRFPVRIELEPPDPGYPYRMGSTAVVTVKGFSSEASD